MADPSSDASSPPANGPEEDGLRAQVRRVIESDLFRNGILVVIIFNAVLLGLETSKGVTDAVGPLIGFLDNACLAIYCVEIALKLFALRLGFFKSGWNIFDLLIVAISLAPTSEGLAVLRALRVLRVFRVITAAPTLRRVVEGFLRALPGMGSVFLLTAVIFYIGSVMATKLFGGTHPEWFGTIGESAYSLFQIMTLESWSMGIVRPVMVDHPMAWAFFVPFILITTFAVVNLVVGLVVNALQELHDEEGDEDTDTYRHDVLAALERIETRLGKLEGERPD
ncbi:MAG: ion transporter [Pseudomonadota bacterium]